MKETNDAKLKLNNQDRQVTHDVTLLCQQRLL